MIDEKNVEEQSDAMKKFLVELSEFNRLNSIKNKKRKAKRKAAKKARKLNR